MSGSSSSDLLLVPSAILVPDELRLDVGSIPTGMIPLRGTPMLEQLAEAYPDHDLTRIVAVNAKEDLVQHHVSRSTYDWTVTDVGNTNGLGETIIRSLSEFGVNKLEDRHLYINFADTLISPIKKLNGSDYVSYQVENRPYRWTTFSIHDGRISDITKKYERSGEEPRPTFVGQFAISDPSRFYESHSKNKLNSDEPQPFYDTLLTYLSDRQYELYEPDTWLDVGHLDTYHRAKKHSLNSRKFNELTVNEKNVITKQSENTAILINEIEWYTQMPTKLQPYLPRVYEWSTDLPAPFIDMEYVGYPSLSDLQLYSSHGQHIWNNVFHRLFEMLDEFQDYTVDTRSQEVTTTLEEIYIAKTQQRLEQLREDTAFTQFFTETPIVNGESYSTLTEILDVLPNIVADNGLLEIDQLSVIHGDLCLPNILYDPRNEILKLIDPRGEFGDYTIYGDPRYDLAKLRHSFVGHYEHLINGQFNTNLTPEQAEILYTIDITSEQREPESRFDEILNSKTSASLSEIQLIEALLYLSMVPLHSDSKERQATMLAQGLEKIQPFME